MADNKTIRENFFDSLSKGAKWDVGVSINRTNPLPLDQYSVFDSETALDAYIAGAFSYPGQIVALIKENETVIYYLDQNKEKQEVGSMPGVDGKSIKIETDVEGNEYLTLVGLKDAKAGASLVKNADGSVGWSTTTQSELDADLGTINSELNKLDVTVFGTETKDADGNIITPTLETLKEKYLDNGLIDRVDDLEDKFDSMGAIFNYKGAITVGDNDTIDTVIDFIPVSGDVVLVNGTQEYVYAEGKWEPFGDPHGVEAIDERVIALEGKVDGYTTEEGTKVPGLIEEVEDIKEEIGVKAEGETVASGIYAYVDSKAASAQSAAETTAQGYTDAQIDLVEAEVAKKADAQGTTDALALKADITYVDGQIDLVEAEVAKKADATETTNALNERATKSELETGLAGKADKTTTEQAISGLDTRLTTAEGDIDKLEAAVGVAGEDGKYPASSINGRLAAIEAVDSAQDTAINGLTSNLGTIEDGAEAGTAFGKAAAAKTLAQTGVDNAATAQAKADSAYTLADEGKTLAGTAKSAADAAQGDATKALADAAAAQEQADKGVADAAAAQGVADSALAAANTKAEKSFVGELPSGTSATTVVGYVDAEIDKVEQAIDDIQIPEYALSTTDDSYGAGIILMKDSALKSLVSFRPADDIVTVEQSGSEGSNIVEIGVDLSNYYTKAEVDAADADTQYGIEYDSVNKKIKLVSDTSKTEIDATDFIKDGMIETVELDEDANEIVITWNTDSDKGENNVTRIPLEGLVDVYTGVDGTTVKVEVSSDNKISAEVKAGTIAKSHLDANVQASLDKADSAIQDISGKADKSSVYTKEEADAAFTDSTEVDGQIDAKITALSLGTMSKESADNYYTKTEADKIVTDLGLGTMSQKDANDYYTKSEVYNKTEAYTKTETDSAIEDALADALEWGTF